MEFHTKVNGFKPKDKDSVYKSGPMALNMLDSGKITKPMDKEPYIMPTETFMKVNGLTIKPVDKEHIHTRMEPNTLENGKTTNKMDTELNNGLTVKSTKDSTKMVQKQARES